VRLGNRHVSSREAAPTNSPNTSEMLNRGFRRRFASPFLDTQTFFLTLFESQKFDSDA
jgi:hypothetical protein